MQQTDDQQTPRKRGGAGTKVAVVLAVLALVLRLAVGGMKTSIVVGMGIRMYNTLESAVTVAAAAFGALAVVGVARGALQGVRQKRSLQASAEQLLESEGRRRHEDSVKAVSEGLADVATDPVVSPQARAAVKSMIVQMEAIDVAQGKLHRLLSENDATLLGDTEDLLDRVETAICKNAKATVNYANVLDLDKPSDEAYFLERVAEYVKKNQDMLDNVQSFLLLTTRYLNEHDEQFDLGTIESYKAAIQHMLDKGQG